MFELRFRRRSRKIRVVTAQNLEEGSANDALQCRTDSCNLDVMGGSEILDEIKSLPPEQRWQVLERTREMLGPAIPESFKQAMGEIVRGEVIELDEALEELDRSE